MSRLFVLFTVVPALELYLLLVLGSWLGPGPTVAMLLLAGAAGAWLVRTQGAQVLRELSEGLQRGESPAPRLVEAGLVLLGGILLLTPGVLTDLLAVALLVPPSRRLLAPVILKALGEAARRSGTRVNLGAPMGMGPDPGRPGRPEPRPAPERAARPPFDHPTF